MTSLKPNQAVPGLFQDQLTLGSKGEESFQIAVGNDSDLILYPEAKDCRSKVAKVLGPQAAPSKDYCWVIKGPAASKVTVEVFKPAGTAYVSWHRELQNKEASAAIADDDDEPPKPAMAIEFE